jgi:hypothetical protein
LTLYRFGCHDSGGRIRQRSAAGSRPGEWSAIGALLLIPPFTPVGIVLLFGGLYGIGTHTANVNQDVEQDFFAKAFRPSVIPAGGTAAGIVFYSASGYQQKQVTKAVLPIVDLRTGRVTNLSLLLPAREEAAAPGAPAP